MTKSCLLSEEWKPVAGYDGMYEVSTHGRVKSCSRELPHNGRKLMEHVMLQSTWMTYKVVWLRKPGEHKKFRVHRLVADAFLAEAHTTDVVNHKDGDKSNNCIENLEWATFSENTLHYHRELKPIRQAAVPLPEDGIDPADLPW